MGTDSPDSVGQTAWIGASLGHLWSPIFWFSEAGGRGRTGDGGGGGGGGSDLTLLLLSV